MLKKKYRLTKKKDFDRLFKLAEIKYYDKLVGVRLIKNNLDYNRFGIIVGRKTNRLAVARNLIKRRIAAVIEQNLNQMNIGYDIVVIALTDLTVLKFSELQIRLIKIWKKIKLLN